MLPVELKYMPAAQVAAYIGDPGMYANACKHSKTFANVFLDRRVSHYGGALVGAGDFTEMHVHKEI